MITVKRKIAISRQAHGCRKVSPAKEKSPEPVGEGRIPRISRLMALAIRLDRMLLTGESKASPSWPAFATFRSPA